MEKYIIIRIILVIQIICICSCKTIAQNYENKTTEILKFKGDNKVFIIENIFGGIQIESVAGNQGRIDIEEKITADNEEILNKIKDELKIKIEYSGDTIFIYPDAPFLGVKREKDDILFNFNKTKENFDFTFNLKAKIPSDAEIIASTVSNGDIRISGISGKLRINNINGGIDLQEIRGEADISTINGKINADYTDKPDSDCTFSTINGDIHITCNSDLSANVVYKSLNGEFYTNFAIAELEPEIIKEEREFQGSMIYKIAHKPKFRIGTGKIRLEFETMNGDMTISYKQ